MKKFIRVSILTFVWSVIALTVQAQNTTLHIKGQVIDNFNSEPLTGATVSAKGTKEGGVITDVDGKFTLKTKAELPVVLLVSFVGYQDQEVDVYDDSEPVTITLSENRSALEEVVVVGYGTQKRTQLTAAISSVDANNLKLPSPSVESALSGAVAGMNVSATSGQPGAASNIRIRGGNSITGGNEPLYVIDGFIIYNDQSATKTGIQNSEAHLDPLSFLNPSDIESIEILKDVSATAIYGTRGANGVIMITTKKGTRGKNNVNYTGNFGFSTIGKKIKMLDAWQFVEAYNEIRTNEQSGDLLPEPTQTYDWADAALRTAFQKEHQLSIVGGDDKSRYAISGGYKNQEGIILGTDYSRYSGRINYEREVLKGLRVGVNANGAYSKQNGLNSGGSGWAPNSWIQALTYAPFIPIYNPDGSYYYEKSIFSERGTNPISDLENVENLTENFRVVATAFAEYEPVKHLTVKYSIGADVNNTRQKYYAPSYTEPSGDYNGVARQGQVGFNTWQSELTVNYNHVLAERHALSYLLGYTTQESQRSGFSAAGRDFANDGYKYNSLGAASDFTTKPSSTAKVSTLTSWLGRVNYSFDERYNFTGTFRADGSSRFAENHRWGFFPSLGGSWNIDREQWINLGKDVNYLQLRASYGVVGNQEIGDYQFASNIVASTYYLGGKSVSASILQNMANPDLKWETTSSFNVGLNAGFFNNRLSATVDYYYKKTSDLLLNVPVEAVTGFNSVLRNVGSVTNQGVELDVKGSIIERRHFTWKVGFNLAHNTNEITSLGEGVESFLPDFSSVGTLTYINPLIVKVGEPLGTFYGYRFKGIVQNDTDISKLPAQTVKTLEPGVEIYEDTNGDNIVNENDRVILGNSQPKLTGGFNTSVNWHRWDFTLTAAFSLGNKLFNATRCRYERTNIVYNSLASTADRWTPTNPTNYLARATSATSIVSDDRYVEDASYLKFRNIQFGYTLPLRQITRDARLRIYVGLQNFFTVTGYKGFDPESNRNGIDETNGLYQGVDFGTYPATKTISFGASLTL